jgi:glycerophosphoryl diester phosphodiesterase
VLLDLEIFMNTIKFDKKNTLMVAHRGLSGIETENTNAAFVAAGNRSYYGIETDIRRTADGDFIVNHDKSLKRVGGVNVEVETTDISVLQSITLLDKDGSRDRADIRPCTLENYISICKKYEKHCVLELKSDFTDDETAAYIEKIKKYDYLDNVTLISFNYDVLLRIRKILPTQSAQFLFKEFTEEILENVKRDKFDVDVYHKALNEEIIKKLHEDGIKVNAWTVDDPERAAELASYGIDFITSNILE